MTDCSRCGLCCDPVIVPFDPQERAAQRLEDPDLESGDRHQYEFFRDHWRSIGKFKPIMTTSLWRIV